MKFTAASEFLLSPTNARFLALDLLAGVNPRGMEAQHQEEYFQAHYGTNSVVIANQWFDLCTTDIAEARLSPAEISPHGFKRFMMAHFFIWQYPKNAITFASRFGVCERLARGEDVWYWVDKIAALHSKMIIWKPNLDSTMTPSMVISIDGIDCRTWERKHERYNRDNKTCSHKHNHGALKYEIAMSLLEPQCAWINGPFDGGKHDITIFREDGLKQKLMRWKKAIVDRGYTSNEEDERDILAIPRTTDSKELNEYKRRARLRHESFNGRLKKYSILDNTFRHNQKHHRSVMLAVAVTVQYEMNNGAPVFDQQIERE